MNDIVIWWQRLKTTQTQSLLTCHTQDVIVNKLISSNYVIAIS